MQTVTKEMVVISVPFTGEMLTYFKGDGSLAFSNCKTLEEYQKERPGVEMKLITWPEYIEEVRKFYIRPFAEITRIEYLAVEHRIAKKKELHESRFFVYYGAQASGTLYEVFLTDTVKGLHYRGVKDVSVTDAEMLKILLEEVKW